MLAIFTSLLCSCEKNDIVGDITTYYFNFEIDSPNHNTQNDFKCSLSYSPISNFMFTLPADEDKFTLRKGSSKFFEIKEVKFTKSDSEKGRIVIWMMKDGETEKSDFVTVHKISSSEAEFSFDKTATSYNPENTVEIYVTSIPYAIKEAGKEKKKKI